MTRILAIARRVYGDDTFALIFEPLVADRDRELAEHRSLLIRARWWFAVALTIACVFPRSTFGKLRAAFVLDLALRAIAFFALAFALQWTGARLRPDSGATGFAPSFTTTFFFIIIPVIWRLRYEAIPIHQQRLLTIAFSTTCGVIALISGSPSAVLGTAIVAGTAWLSFFSWRFYTAAMSETLPMRPLLAGIYPACAIIAASAPIKLALGVALWQSWWPGDGLVAYVIGGVIAFSAKGLDIGEAGYRRIYGTPTSIFRRD